VISIVQTRAWRCASCGHSTAVSTWLAIDLVERADLRSYLASGAWRRATCERCGGGIERSEPLLVTRLSSAAPVMIGVSEDHYRAGGIPVEANVVIERVREALGDDGRDVPGPLLSVPFKVLDGAAERDVERDVADPAPALAAFGDGQPEAATLYGSFLKQVRDSSFDRRLSWGLNRLRVVRDVTELAQLFAELPELGSDQALAGLQASVDRATDPEELLIAQSQLALWKAAVSGDFEAGWKAREGAVRRIWDDHLGPRIDHLHARIQALEEGQDWSGLIDASEQLLEIVRLGGPRRMRSSPLHGSLSPCTKCLAMVAVPDWSEPSRYVTGS
jgi:CpXC motif protein